MRAFRPSAEAGQVVLETSRSKNISQLSPFSSAANTHVKRQHRSGTRTDSTAFPQAGALVWTMTEVLNTPAAAAALPALADRAMALAALLREVLLGLCVALPAHTVFSPVQRFAGAVSQCRGDTRVMLAWGCMPLALQDPLSFTVAARHKRLTPDFCLEAGVSWKNIISGCKVEEEMFGFFFSPSDLSPAV